MYFPQINGAAIIMEQHDTSDTKISNKVTVQNQSIQQIQSIDYTIDSTVNKQYSKH